MKMMSWYETHIRIFKKNLPVMWKSYYFNALDGSVWFPFNSRATLFTCTWNMNQLGSEGNIILTSRDVTFDTQKKRKAKRRSKRFSEVGRKLKHRRIEEKIICWEGMLSYITQNHKMTTKWLRCSLSNFLFALFLLRLKKAAFVSIGRDVTSQKLFFMPLSHEGNFNGSLNAFELYDNGF